MGMIGYIQCDARFNKGLLMQIDDKTVIEYVLDKIQDVHANRYVMNLFNCTENREVATIAQRHFKNLEILFSEIENVNQRLISFVEQMHSSSKENGNNYILRIPDNVMLVDAKWMNNVIVEMQKENYDWYFEKNNDGRFLDIISCETLLRFRAEILQETRYYKALNKIGEGQIRKYNSSYPGELNVAKIPFSNETAIRIVKEANESGQSLSDVINFLMVKLFAGDNYFIKTGWLESIFMINRKQFINIETPIPWFTYPAIDFIKSRINKEMVVFEWGSGNSTLFWQKNVKKVFSVENDADWYEETNKLIMNNVFLKYIKLEEDGEYAKEILKYNKKFDIIVIDGRDRVNCSEKVMGALKEDGIIIWDNTEIEEYSRGYQFLKDNGFRRIDFSGLLPWHSEIVITTIFYRNSNIFGI